MYKRIKGLFAALIVAGVLATGTGCSQKSAAASESQAAPITGLEPDHATLSVENLEAEASWYERVFGFTVFRRIVTDPDHINQQMAIPGYRIDLIKYKGSTRPAPVEPLYLQQGWIHVVFHVDDFPGALKKLAALQVQPKEIRKDDKGNAISFLLRDPENNEIEVRQKGQ